MPLSGVRVLELGRVMAAPLAGQILGDLGAEVIKVERPGVGDDSRVAGLPLLKGQDGAPIPGYAAYFLSVNRNKRSITANLAHPQGQQLVRDLAGRCQVLIENYKSGDLARYGLDYASLRKTAPHLIYCSITGYGQTGPMAGQPGFDGAFQARSGLMAVTGEPDGEPQKVGVHIVDYITGQSAVVAILAALRHVEVGGGEGQHLDLALLDNSIAAMTTVAQRHLMSGEVPPRTGARVKGSVVSRLFDCQDGTILVSAPRDDAFKRLARVAGLDTLADDPRFATPAGRYRHEGVLDAAFEPVFAARPVAAWLAALEAAQVICAPIYAIDQALADPQARARGAVVHAEHPAAGRVGFLASPIRMSETPVERYAPPPALGADQEAVLGEYLGLSAEAVAALRAAGAI
jgi:crotonobetainyl-CoA:carnitine CoA-transferase CaiB-like acyl-CoA transferase